MPPFRRRNYYYRNWWSYKNRRNRYRRRRFRKTLRRKPWRRVRRQRFSKQFKKKLKKLKIAEWQPSYIRKCRISGFLCLFEAGPGTFANNFATYKESYTQHNTPGGGGWSLQQLTLANLFTQNREFMNIWTSTNSGLNLMRYLGCKLTIYRQKTTDIIFTYYTEDSTKAGKFWYPSFHPIELLTHNKRVIIPSLATQPTKRKAYKRIHVKPPKLMKNNWYFQQHICTYPLIRFAAAATSLQEMFIPPTSNNSNITIKMLNTGLFLHSAFQYRKDTEGYIPKTGTYIYGLPNGTQDIEQEQKQFVIYLGGQINQEGDSVGTKGFTTYKKETWGNIFYWKFFDFHLRTFLSSKPPNDLLQNTSAGQKIGPGVVQKQEPYYFDTRYNPYKDKGDGNIAYWKSVSDVTNNNWDPPSNPDLKISGYPFWLMLWGWEDYTRRLAVA